MQSMQLMNIIKKHGRLPENLIHILLEYQETKSDNCISETEIETIAHEMNISESRVYSVVTFYSLFSTKPRGKYIIQVCDNVPCYVNGSVNIVKELEDNLGIKMGETTPDKVFSLEYASCLGCCDKSPTFRIGSNLYSGLTPDKIPGIIAQYRRKYDESRE